MHPLRTRNVPPPQKPLDPLKTLESRGFSHFRMRPDENNLRHWVFSVAPVRYMCAHSLAGPRSCFAEDCERLLSRVSERKGDCVQVVTEEVSVSVEGHRGRSVAKRALDRFHVCVDADSQAGRCVAQVVGSNSREGWVLACARSTAVANHPACELGKRMCCWPCPRSSSSCCLPWKAARISESKKSG